MIKQSHYLFVDFAKSNGAPVELDGITIHKNLSIACGITTVITIKIIQAKNLPRQKLSLYGEACKLNIGGDLYTLASMWSDKIKEQKVYPEKVKDGATIGIYNGWMNSVGVSESLVRNGGMLIEKLSTSPDVVAKFLLRCNDGFTYPAKFDSLIAEVTVQEGSQYRPIDISFVD